MGCSLNQPHNRSSLTRRSLTAWLLIFVCAWMGTGGVLHHSEDVGKSQAKSFTAAHLGRQSAPPIADACAACEWTQGLTAKTSTIISLPSPLFLLCPYTLPAPTRPAASALRLRSSRAPPVLA